MDVKKEINLNVFTCETRLKGFHPIKNTRLFFRKIKWAYQRIVYGVCDADTWDLYEYIRCSLIQSLKLFKSEIDGYPDSFNSLENWKNEIDKIIKLLEQSQDYTYSLSEDENKYAKDFYDMMESIRHFENHSLVYDEMTEEQQKLKQNYCDECKRIIDEQKSNLKSAFDLLAEYRRDLWW